MAYRVGRCLLRYHLKEKRMSQRQLAHKLDVTVQQINKYATDKQLMSIQVAKNIAVILNCDMSDLYEWVETGVKE